MRTTSDVFHLAIPVHDLDAAQHFYVSMLGCKLARRYPDRITLDFFGDQLVCHLAKRDAEVPWVKARGVGVGGLSIGEVADQLIAEEIQRYPVRVAAGELAAEHAHVEMLSRIEVVHGNGQVKNIGG